MSEKYKVSVKSFWKKGKSLIGSGRTYDVVVGQQELKNVAQIVHTTLMNI